MAEVTKATVYFQPPENVKMKYPCAVYDLDMVYTQSADNRNYINTDRYDVTYISRSPSVDIVNEIMKSFSMINMNRSYTMDGLYHYNFTLYY